jgi:hypothetical protein
MDEKKGENFFHFFVMSEILGIGVGLRWGE